MVFLIFIIAFPKNENPFSPIDEKQHKMYTKHMLNVGKWGLDGEIDEKRCLRQYPRQRQRRRLPPERRPCLSLFFLRLPKSRPKPSSRYHPTVRPGWIS